MKGYQWYFLFTWIMVFSFIAVMVLGAYAVFQGGIKASADMWLKLSFALMIGSWFIRRGIASTFHNKR